MAISELMTLVLQKLNLSDAVNKFSEQKISPDIVCLLSSHELQELGITNRGDMVKLRNECIRYGTDQPRKLKDVYGPPKFQIPKQLIVTLINEGFRVSDIANLLSVSERTLYRRMQEFNISKCNFSQCTDDELDNYIVNVINEFPFCGENFLGQILKNRGLHVQRYRLRESIHRVDNKGVSERKKNCLKRRVYNVKGPNHLWHIDTNHKLIRWNMIIAGGIDGFSRLITFLKCLDNNKAETLLKVFMDGVKTFGIPQRVRSDKGLENVAIADFMIKNRGTDRGSMITGKSVHNQRIERLWRDVFTGVLSFYYHLFYHMEDEGILDPLNDCHIAALHYTFIPHINNKLQVWKEAWARHKIRTVKSSPINMWISGQMQNTVGIEHDNIDMYGVEGYTEIDRNIASDDTRPMIDSISSLLINDQCLTELNEHVSTVWNAIDSGIQTYMIVLETINRYVPNTAE